jgi:ABC-type long-subunit fatty acid transport system fused permease/ATPase subunit
LFVLFFVLFLVLLVNILHIWLSSSPHLWTNLAIMKTILCRFRSRQMEMLSTCHRPQRDISLVQAPRRFCHNA